MALTFIRMDSVPTYLALSTDISGSKIAGAGMVGKTVYITDLQKWYIINSDETLVPYFSPKLQTA